MPAKPLTPEQKADAAELMKLFKEKAAEEKAGRLTQATLADDLGYTTQSAVSQYLNGKVPLNIDASIKFATRFGCRVSDFSPSIQKEIDRIAQFATKTGGANEENKTSQPEREPQKALSKRSLIERYDAANEETRAAIDLILLPQSERTRMKKSLLLAIGILEEDAKEALLERKKDAA